ncbi:TonB-dependent receptor [Paraflavisolibacter sp. H34]|uniref:TonB-dependent receptor n=1 Tax=Huijunlia imazamoxiresistens TaxID=3127457 RepID=UPI0030192902
MKKKTNIYVPIPLFLLFSLFTTLFAGAQNSVLSGKVADPAGKALAGATVKIKELNKGTQTNEQGAFSFPNVPATPVTVVVSYVGYNTREMKVSAGKGQLVISLEEFGAQGEEVVVTGVFDKRKKMEASVAISTLSAAQVARLAPVSAADLLRNVPGVYVNSSLGEVRNTVYSRGVSVGSNDGASGYYYVSLQEDGLPVTNATYNNYGPDYFLRADATVGRLEAVRGGTASIMGSNAPGGIFNYISKEGGPKFAGEFRAKYGLEGDGRFPYYRADINVGGPLGKVKDLYYNIGGFVRHAQGARDPGYPMNRGFQWKANVVKKYKTGTLKLYAKYLNDHNGWFEFTPTVGFSDPKPAPGFNRYSSVLIAPVTQTFALNSDPNNTDTYDSRNLIHSLDRQGGLNWEQRLGSGWTVNNNLRYSDKEANWNTTAIVYPLAFDDYISYAFIGAIAANSVPKFGTYTFRDAINGKEYGKTMLLPNMDANGNFIGFNTPVLASNFPGKEVSPNSLFFNPLFYTKNHVREFLDQFSINKKLRKMSFTAGGFYGRTTIRRVDGIVGIGFGTIEDKPRLTHISYTDFGGKTYQVTNSQGLAGIGGGGQSIKEALQRQMALYFGHNWQIGDKLNLDWGARYERVSVEGFNNLPFANPQASAPGYGGVDGNPLTLYDNGGGLVRKDTLYYGYDKSLSTFSFSAGLNYKINNSLAFYGRYSDGRKSPDATFFLGMDAPGRTLLEPKAQRVQQLEAGVKVKKNSLNLFVTPFYSVLSNVPEQQVGQNPDNTMYSTPFLLNKYRTCGVEVEGDYSFAKYFNIRSVATLQQSKAVDYKVWILNDPGLADDKVLDNSGGRTDNSANVILNNTISYNRDKFYGSVIWSYLGKRQANIANAFALPAFSQFHFSAGYDFTKHFQLSLNINNLTNVYGVMSWSRPGTFLTATDRQGYTKEMMKANPNAVYSTIAITPRAYYLTGTFKF